jgi:hypothetical protein
MERLPLYITFFTIFIINCIVEIRKGYKNSIMDEKRAGEIYDYIESHQSKTIPELAEGLNMTVDEIKGYVANFCIHPRGEFIFLLTKKE